MAADGKGRTGWAVWAVSHSQNNGLFTAPASELAVGHQRRKGLTVPLRTPSLPKGQKCQLSLPSSCLVATLVPQGPGPCSLPASSPAPAAGAVFPRDGAPGAALVGAGGREVGGTADEGSPRPHLLSKPTSRESHPRKWGWRMGEGVGSQKMTESRGAGGQRES